MGLIIEVGTCIWFVKFGGLPCDELPVKGEFRCHQKQNKWREYCICMSQRKDQFTTTDR